MSYKYHNQQKKRKWAETGTVFRPAFLAKVAALKDGTQLATPSIKALADELHNFSQIQFTYGELEDLKGVLAVWEQGGFNEDLDLALSLLLEVVFADNSRPLHRSILSVLKKMNAPGQQEAIARALQSRILQEASEYLAQSSASSSKPRVVLGQTLASLLWLPSFQQWVQPVSIPAVHAVAHSTHQVLKAANAEHHIAPSLMNEMQDGISALYYIIQKHGNYMASSDAGSQALLAAAQAMIYALQGQVLVREAMASASVVIWAACLCPGVDPGHVAAQLAQGLFLTPEQLKSGMRVQLGAGADTQQAAGHVEQGLAAQGTSLAREVSLFSHVGKICALKGLVTTVGPQAMSAALLVTPPQPTVTPPADDLAPRAAPALLQPGQQFTFLVDGALAYGCQQVTLAPDAHFKFHAACVTHTCMSQLLNLWAQADEGSVPPRLPPATLTMMLDMLWAHLEEPLAQTLRQLQGAFEMLLELIGRQHQAAAAAASPGASPAAAASLTEADQVQGTTSMDALFLHIATQLVTVPATRKGRYVRLASVVQYVGAQRLLGLHPALIDEALQVMQEERVAHASAHCLKMLLEQLRKECQDQEADAAANATAAGAVTDGASSKTAWYAWWLPTLMTAIASDNDKLRVGVSVHFLPVLLPLDPSLFITLVQQINSSQGTGQQADAQQPAGNKTAALISLLRSARQLQLIAELDSLVKCKESLGMDVEQVLLDAVVHSSEVVRVDCLELVALNPRQSEPPGQLELKVVCRFLSNCLRSTSMGQRPRVIVLLSKLMARIKASVGAIQTRAANQAGGALKARPVVPVVGLKPDEAHSSPQTPVDPLQAARQADLAAVHTLEVFCQWVSCSMVGCLYPGAPYERKYLAIEVLNSMLAVWQVPAQQQGPGAAAAQAPAQKGKAGAQVPSFNPYPASVYSAHVVQLLLANAIDSWDKLRQSASTALMRLPTPWPGVNSPTTLTPLLQWAFQLLCSPRLREADAGARMLKLVFAKYVGHLKWHIQLGSSITVESLPESGGPAVTGAGEAGPDLLQATRVFITSLLDVVDGQCQLAEQPGEDSAGLLAACRTSFAHGPLLLLRYTIEEVKWLALAGSCPEGASTLKQLINRTLSLLERVAGLASVPLVAPVEGVGAEDVDGGDVQFDGDMDGGDDEGDGAGDGCTPDAQVIITGCWLSIKEVSLVAGTLVHCVPLAESAASSDDHPAGGEVSDSVVALLDVVEVQRLATLLVDSVLLRIKHNGALDKASMGLTTLAAKLLRSTNLGLSRQPPLMMAQIIKQLITPGQCLDDISRRSAGLPLGMVALSKAEPSNSSKGMLNRALQQLLAIAQDGAPALWTVKIKARGMQAADTTSPDPADPPEEAEQEVAEADEQLGGESALTGGPGPGLDPSWPTASVDEPWPRVHAFNCLRNLFNDSQLAVDTSGQYAAGLQACISALGSTSWEVRNAATYCFTALVIRVLGFKNVGRWENPKRAITGGEFFQRFPGLHSFLLSQLQEAVQQLEADEAALLQGTNLAAATRLPDLHPSLFPVLILLSRLRPGPPLEAKGTGMSPALSPALFAPLVRRCAAARHLAVRQLAARALAPLIPSEQVAAQLLLLLPDLPGSSHPDARSAVAAAAAERSTITLEGSAGVGEDKAAAGRIRLPTNRLQGVLMHVEALLRHNVRPGRVEQVLSLVSPHLLAAIALLSPTSTSTTRSSSGVLAGLLRACQAAVSLLQPDTCHRFMHLIKGVSSFCQTVILAAHSHVSTASAGSTQLLAVVDFNDPMRSTLLKEAALTWVGLVSVCEACVHPGTLVSTPPPGAAPTDCLISRLSTCLAHGCMDVRAGAAKAAAGVLASITARLCTAHLLPGSSESVDAASSSSTPSTGMQADEERWAHITAALASAITPGTPGDLGSLASTASQLVWTQLTVEPVFKVRKRLLRLLQGLHVLQQRVGAPQETVELGLQHVVQVQRLLVGAQGLEERAEALRCLGQQLQLVTSHHLEGGTGAAGVVSGLAPALEAFCGELEASSGAAEPDDMRLATVDALAACHLLHWQPDPAGGQEQVGLQQAALRCWLVALKLSEDEDERVRGIASHIMQTAMASSCVAAAGLHVEGTQRRAFMLLSHRFAACSSLISALCDLVVPRSEPLPDALQQLVSAAASSSLGEGQVISQPQGRIFDAELDNQHEEPLFFAQLAAQQLLSSAGSQAGAAEMLKQRSTEAVSELKQVAQLLYVANSQGNSGVTRVNHVMQNPLVLPYCYRRMLLAWVGLQLAGDSWGVESAGQLSPVLSQFQSVGALGGPLASVAGNLMQRLGEAAGQSISWQGLSALFLTDDGSAAFA